DKLVTGVQTCALPICLQADLRSENDPIKRLILQRELALQYVYGGTAEPGIALLEKLLLDYGKSLPVRDIETLKADVALAYFRLRSEERRVGKECRSWG